MWDTKTTELLLHINIHSNTFINIRRHCVKLWLAAPLTLVGQPALVHVKITLLALFDFYWYPYQLMYFRSLSIWHLLKLVWAASAVSLLYADWTLNSWMCITLYCAKTPQALGLAAQSANMRGSGDFGWFTVESRSDWLNSKQMYQLIIHLMSAFQHRSRCVEAVCVVPLCATFNISVSVHLYSNSNLVSYNKVLHLLNCEAADWLLTRCEWHEAEVSHWIPWATLNPFLC